jgi:uncharacterized protein YejL (UPF0352 family)
MQAKNQKKSPDVKSISDKIIDLILSDCDSIMNKEQAHERLKLLVFMMTNKQKEDIFNKLERCLLFITKIDKGLEESRVRSILKNKHNISRQNLDSVCEPCKVFMSSRKKK